MTLQTTPASASDRLFFCPANRVKNDKTRHGSDNNPHFTADPILQKRIQTMARGNEDRAQKMYLALLERDAADKTFAKQQLGYHIKYAKFMAQHDVTLSGIYDRYVASEDDVMAPDNSHENEAFDTLIDLDAETPEDTCIRNEAANALHTAIEALPDNRRQIMGLFLKGYEPSEIAAKTGSSASSINHIIRKTCATLRQSL